MLTLLIVWFGGVICTHFRAHQVVNVHILLLSHATSMCCFVVSCTGPLACHTGGTSDGRGLPNVLVASQAQSSHSSAVRGLAPAGRPSSGEMGGAPRNPAPRNLFLARIVKPAGCHCTNEHLTSRDEFSGWIKTYYRVPTPLRSTSPFSDSFSVSQPWAAPMRACGRAGLAAPSPTSRHG